MTAVYSIDARIEVPVRDTEVTSRVVTAVQNLFPNADPETRPGKLVAETHTLDPLSAQLHEQEILDTARREFKRNSRQGGFSFALKKQAAFQGVVNFAVGDPDELGDIEVDVVVREPSVDAFIDRITPPTEDGIPVDPGDRAGDR